MRYLVETTLTNGEKARALTEDKTSAETFFQAHLKLATVKSVFVRDLDTGIIIYRKGK